MLAGCGGGTQATSTEPLTPEEYQEQVSALAREAGDRLRESANLVQGITAESVRRSAVEIRALSDEVAALNAPRNVLHAHRELIQGLRDFSVEFPDAMERTGYSRDPQTVLAALTQLPSYRLLQHAQLEFRRLGYTIELG